MEGVKSVLGGRDHRQVWPSMAKHDCLNVGNSSAIFRCRFVFFFNESDVREKYACPVHEYCSSEHSPFILKDSFKYNIQYKFTITSSNGCFLLLML